MKRHLYDLWRTPKTLPEEIAFMLKIKLWHHFEDRKHKNLQALTHKWIKEHQ